MLADRTSNARCMGTMQLPEISLRPTLVTGEARRGVTMWLEGAATGEVADKQWSQTMPVVAMMHGHVLDVVLRGALGTAVHKYHIVRPPRTPPLCWRAWMRNTPSTLYCLVLCSYFSMDASPGMAMG
jgi:hypothetical protein